VTVQNLHLSAGSDIAEPFSIDETVNVEPGTVMVIDEDHEGELKTSDRAYDTKVAGIVSGARDLRPGITLCQDTPSIPSANMRNVALSGRVYCKAEAISSPIRAGDLLTTSAIPGHAMKAVNPVAAGGALLGKAMTALGEGQGLVLVLVGLH
jgi:hypothetical protein